MRRTLEAEVHAEHGRVRRHVRRRVHEEDGARVGGGRHFREGEGERGGRRVGGGGDDIYGW